MTEQYLEIWNLCVLANENKKQAPNFKNKPLIRGLFETGHLIVETGS